MIANRKSPLIIGHRGASAVAPENTIAAFNRALADGADGIEFDVRLSRDGIPVVIHDATLERTANRHDAVSSLTAGELENVDVGSWFNRRFRNRARDEYANERLPTLERLVAAMVDQGGLLYLELKSDEAANEKLVRAVARLIGAYDFCDRVVVESFQLVNLQLIKRFDARIRTAALFEPRPHPLSLMSGRRLIKRAMAVGADELALHYSSVNRRVVSAAKQSGLSIVVWTVDAASWVGRAQHLGVEALITNRPAEMLQARESAHD